MELFYSKLSVRIRRELYMWGRIAKAFETAMKHRGIIMDGIVKKFIIHSGIV